ncbi:DUF58 domain-containing protein [Verrucomicrobia bacterium LW23]|nr:DUF58 domain-containing protein [Verrucomicrobia bacterium LW23]
MSTSPNAVVQGTSLLEPDVVARLMRAGFQARQPMSGNMSGSHRSPHKGSSVEFAEYRKYVQGDDIRMLDWRVYARTDRFYMKEFEADTNLRAFFVLDASASMNYAGAAVSASGAAPFGGAGEHAPGGPRSKVALARRLVATMAYLLVKQGDAAGLSCASDKMVVEIPARRNPSHLSTLFQQLEGLRAAGTTELPAVLHTLAEKMPRRSLVVITSDLFCDAEAFADALRHLRHRNNDVIVFHTLDRTEIDFPFTGPIRFLDLESPFTLLAEPEIIRDQYLTACREHLAAIRHACDTTRTEYRQVLTDEPYENALASTFLDRIRGKR